MDSDYLYSSIDSQTNMENRRKVILFFNNKVIPALGLQVEKLSGPSWRWNSEYTARVANLVKEKVSPSAFWDYLRNEFKECSECKKWDFNGECRATSTGNFCSTCFQNRFTRCNACREYIDSSSEAWMHGSEGCCVPCCTERVSNRDCENKIVGSTDHGDTLKTGRVWSCEIEHYYLDKKKAKAAYDKMPDFFGIAHDGSLSSTSYGGKSIVGAKEVQTCLLRGKESEGLIRSVLENFKGAGFVVDRTCGLHIHLDVSDIENDVEAMKNLLAFHIVFEPVVQLFVPQGRRRNRYARVISSDYSLETLKEVSDEEEEALAGFWYKTDDYDHIQDNKRSHYNETRYYGFNMHPFFQGHNNVEIRHHSGTLSAQKILEWVNLHCRIIDKCESLKFEDIQKMKGKPLDELVNKFFEIVELEPESKAYFVGRAKKFDAAKIAKDESDMSIPEKAILALPEEKELRRAVTHGTPRNNRDMREMEMAAREMAAREMAAAQSSVYQRMRDNIGRPLRPGIRETIRLRFDVPTSNTFITMRESEELENNEDTI